MNPVEQYSLLTEEERGLIEQVHALQVRLDEIRQQKDKIVSEYIFIPKKEQKLEFAGDKKTIRFGNDQITLSPQHYKMIRVLWLAKKRRLKTYRLCEKIWRSSSTPDKTIKQAIYRLNEKLESNSFPYKICPIKSERTGEITGYGLRFSK